MGMDGNSMMLLGTVWLMQLVGRQVGARLTALLLLPYHSSGSLPAPALPSWDGRASPLCPWGMQRSPFLVSQCSGWNKPTLLSPVLCCGDPACPPLLFPQQSPSAPFWVIFSSARNSV